MYLLGSERVRTRYEYIHRVQVYGMMWWTTGGGQVSIVVVRLCENAVCIHPSREHHSKVHFVSGTDFICGLTAETCQLCVKRVYIQRVSILVWRLAWCLGLIYFKETKMKIFYLFLKSTNIYKLKKLKKKLLTKIHKWNKFEWCAKSVITWTGRTVGRPFETLTNTSDATVQRTRIGAASRSLLPNRRLTGASAFGPRAPWAPATVNCNI